MFIILIENRPVISYRDESKVSNCTRDVKAIWLWEFIFVIVPLVESMLVFFPLCYELMSVFHHIFPFMAIDIHPIFQFSISPAKSSQPAL